MQAERHCLSQVTWNVPEWLYMSLQGEAWQARHSGPCHLNLCMINPQTGQQSFDTLEDARSIRDLAYDIYKVLREGHSHKCRQLIACDQLL